MPTAIPVNQTKLFGQPPAAPAKASPSANTIAAPRVKMAADQLSLSQAAPRTWRESAGYVRDDANGDLAIWRSQDMSQDKPHFSAKARFEAVCKNPVEGNWACEGPRFQQIKTTAQAGRYLSTEVNDGGSLPGAAHPWASATLQTLDMQTGKPVSLDTLFPPHAIYAAMMKDPLIREALAGAKPKNLEELRETLAGKTLGRGVYMFPAEGLLDHFSFHHVKGDEVAIRLALPPAVEAARGTYTQLGLYLPIPTELKRPLQLAAGRDNSPAVRAGVLWEELERKGGNPAVRFQSLK